MDDIDETFTQRLECMKKELEGFTGEISLHAFLFDLCAMSLDPLIKKVSQKRFQMSFDAAKFLGAKTVVFHTGFNMPLKHKIYHSNCKKNLIAFWTEFVKQFEEEGIVAVLENVQELNPDFIYDVVKTVNSPNLKASIDIGHVNIHANTPVVEWIKKYGDILYHMHLHNNCGNDDSHSSLLNGNLNIVEIFNTIKELNLNPKMVFEIFTKEEVIESVKLFDSIFEKEQA